MTIARRFNAVSSPATVRVPPGRLTFIHRFGVKHIDMPLRPEKLWAVMQNGNGKA